MRKFGVVLICLLLATAARAGDAPRTVGDYANAMNAAADALDRQLAERQKAGDAAGAQRLALVSAMVRRGGAEFRSAEQEHIVDDVSALPPAVRAKLDAAFALTQDAARRAAPDPRFVDEAHAGFNALIEALPVKTPHPTFYGLLSADLADPQGALPADVVIYGDRLVDPLYGEAPQVRVGDTDLPPDALKLRDGRIEVTLPPAARAQARFAPPPCEPRPSFGLRVHAVYARALGFWPLIWHTRVETNADLYALASPVWFEARVEALAETQDAAASTQTFEARSPFAVADCEETRTVVVEAAAPEGASEVTCKAAWTDAAGQTATSGQCERHGGVLRASGVLTGPAKICSPDKLCTCSTRAQGFLQISGAYRIAETAPTLAPVPDVAPFDFPAGGLARREVSAPKLRQIKIDVARRDCPRAEARLQIGLGGDESGAAVSPTGAFRAKFAGGALSVGAAEAFAP